LCHPGRVHPRAGIQIYAKTILRLHFGEPKKRNFVCGYHK
jgi:hypothetical protein